MKKVRGSMMASLSDGLIAGGKLDDSETNSNTMNKKFSLTDFE